MHSAVLAVPKGVWARAECSRVWSFIRLTFYIHSNSCVSGEHGPELKAIMGWIWKLSGLYTGVWKKLAPSHSVHPLISCWICWCLSLSLLAGAAVGLQATPGSEHLCLLQRGKFSIAGRGFFLSLILLSGFVLPKVIVSLKQYRDSFQILRGYILGFSGITSDVCFCCFC